MVPRAILLLTVCILWAGPMARPRYTAAGELIRPEGWREWKFVAANYGMGYTEGSPETAANATFHNIYIQPEAFAAYKKSGVFPDGAMLVMEVVKPGTNASINKRGVFQDQFLGIEVALKDSKRFPEKWAYFNFIDREHNTQLAQSKAFPKKSCWDCHNQHAAADNVFVQFYPALRDARTH
ncbi:MAG: cytochrome P460 family protein [Bryobacteraceae bacterium]